jgi:hypothetical protein
MLSAVKTHVRYAIMVLLAFIGLIMLSKWTGRREVPGFVAAPSISQVQSLTERAAAANFASHKTADPVRALVEVSTALATLSATTSLVGQGPVTKAAGVAPQQLEHEMLAHQGYLIRSIQKSY